MSFLPFLCLSSEAAAILREQSTALAHLSQHTVQKYQYTGESLADESHPLYTKTIYEK